MKEYRPLSYYLGTFLMICASAVFLYIYLPIVIFFLLPQPMPIIPKQGYYIQIPNINAFAPILINVNPFNEKEYQEKLKSGVAHAKGTSLPGQDGTSFLFAHSSGAPWTVSRYNIVFFRLGDLKIGNSIFVWNNGTKIHYTVTEKKEVWPNEVSYLVEKQRADLILQTCTPIGTSIKRLLVFADKINS